MVNDDIGGNGRIIIKVFRGTRKKAHTRMERNGKRLLHDGFCRFSDRLVTLSLSYTHTHSFFPFYDVFFC